jgi:hypothetical protein
MRTGFASVASMLCTQQNPRKLLLECLFACLLVFSAAKLGMKVVSSRTDKKKELCVHVGCSAKGISLVAIDRNKLLTEQGPFDVILHKVG